MSAKRFWKKAVIQAAVVLVLSCVAGLAANALRSDGLRFLPEPGQEDGFVPLGQAGELHRAGAALFLDARSQVEFEEGHIAGALNLPPEEFGFYYDLLAERIAGADVVITYCDGEHCLLSQDLGRLLREKGHQQIRILKNGWSLWREAGLPVLSGAMPLGG
ncbi:MAG TPA: rhodanese-like domain-containing protein [Desulfovibrio sp.]|uniref:rhodanese-like domain-containing protein n=1 Tax=Desulfovibrio sp. TaxID=885 RepID=UPI002C4BB666|nr:rhodanese-like domain-containing protein [Desulfovibrio sp.]HMM37534.1 rhodanese-like domain-containing protein [Desulfovibrio sp.]